MRRRRLRKMTDGSIVVHGSFGSLMLCIDDIILDVSQLEIYHAPQFGFLHPSMMQSSSLPNKADV